MSVDRNIVGKNSNGQTACGVPYNGPGIGTCYFVAVMQIESTFSWNRLMDDPGQAGSLE